MNQPYCDFSPLKQALNDEIREVIMALQNNLEVMDNENYCLLENFEKIKEQFISIDMKAASFYLNCYLAPFTDKYLDLSICIQNMSSRRHGGSYLDLTGISTPLILASSTGRKLYYCHNP